MSSNRAKTLTRVTMTQADIAKIAGVARSTVSYALQGKPNVSKENRERILKICRDYNYRPNFMGQNLGKQKLNSIFVVVPDIGNVFYSDQATLITENLGAKGYDVFPQCLQRQQNNNGSNDATTSLANGKATGVIFVADNQRHRDICEDLTRTLPIVAIGNIHGKYSSVSVDLFHSGNLAGQHLLSKGRKKLLFLGTQATPPGPKTICAGFRHALAESGVTATETLLMDTTKLTSSKTLSYELGYLAATQLIHTFPGTDGVFCYTDHYAMGLIMGLMDLGVRVPDDIAVVGHDNSRDSLFAKVPLTTLQWPFEQVASSTCNILLNEIESFPDYTIEHEEFQCSLIERKSTNPDWSLGDNIQKQN